MIQTVSTNRLTDIFSVKPRIPVEPSAEFCGPGLLLPRSIGPSAFPPDSSGCAFSSSFARRVSTLRRRARTVRPSSPTVASSSNSWLRQEIPRRSHPTHVSSAADEKTHRAFRLLPRSNQHHTHSHQVWLFIHSLQLIAPFRSFFLVRPSTVMTEVSRVDILRLESVNLSTECRRSTHRRIVHVFESL